MHGKLTASLVTLLSMFALGAAGASPALAEGELTAEEYPAILETTLLSHVTFKIKGKTATCKVEHFVATLNAKTDVTTYESEYTGCTHPAGMINYPMTIDMNGCDWDHYTKLGEFYLYCPAGKAPVLKVYSSAEFHQKKSAICEYTVPAPQELGYSSYENVTGSPDDIRLDVELTGIEYTVTGFPLLCGENGTFNDGTASGEATLSAKNEAGEPVGLMIG